ncbi:hypothetical protein GZH53_12560 [Flavihumibacter sp. R14]|nr:hypothetical protein [Flavihumibacter soli]
MVNKRELESRVGDVLAEAENTDDKIVQFSLIWEGTVKPALSLVKLITGPKVDERLDKLTDAADGLTGGGEDGINKFAIVWNTFQIRPLLKTVQIFTGPKVDKALNKFILIADSISGNDDEM